MSTILITGSSRGIGLALVKTLLQNSPSKRIIATCRDPNSAKDLSQLQSQYSDRLSIEPLNVSDEKDVLSLIDRLKQQHAAVSVLVNNAGIYSAMHKETLLNSTKESMLKVYETNVIAPMLIIQHLYNAKLFEKGALVVNISSIMGSIAPTFERRGVSYSCSKAALNMLTKMVSIELPDVHAISIHPGWVQTDMGGKDAPVKVEDSASGIAKIITNFDAKTQNGSFVSYDGSAMQCYRIVLSSHGD
ncbi:hypothetical protein C9374_005346 [Naegleria lovaniensis]|uniref:Uncharacterized protein n=1 Tax=Naegleria lovaniensis TaxID=51637 RepID=A0AA88KHT9_NAELO|nr:uncharacterized protein C9374_005346 [Naegleria lovaniensis]KAG2382144.1 hypothetical protein C9374_005346 [Naegleria lovaniensis]